MANSESLTLSLDELITVQLACGVAIKDYEAKFSPEGLAYTNHGHVVRLEAKVTAHINSVLHPKKG
jgi:hypothetical protein